MNEHRTRHLDLVIKCERTNELWRGAAHAGQPLRELCARFDLDISGEPAQHIIEQRYLFVRIAARTSREQISDPVNDFEAMSGTGGGNRADQFIEHRSAFREGMS